MIEENQTQKRMQQLRPAETNLNEGEINEGEINEIEINEIEINEIEVNEIELNELDRNLSSRATSPLPQGTVKSFARPPVKPDIKPFAPKIELAVEPPKFQVPDVAEISKPVFREIEAAQVEISPLKKPLVDQPSSIFEPVSLPTKKEIATSKLNITHVPIDLPMAYLPMASQEREKPNAAESQNWTPKVQPPLYSNFPAETPTIAVAAPEIDATIELSPTVEEPEVNPEAIHGELQLPAEALRQFEYRQPIQIDEPAVDSNTAMDEAPRPLQLKAYTQEKNHTDRQYRILNSLIRKSKPPVHVETREVPKIPARDEFEMDPSEFRPLPMMQQILYSETMPQNTSKKTSYHVAMHPAEKFLQVPEGFHLVPEGYQLVPIRELKKDTKAKSQPVTPVETAPEMPVKAPAKASPVTPAEAKAVTEPQPAERIPAPQKAKPQKTTRTLKSKTQVAVSNKILIAEGVVLPTTPKQPQQFQQFQQFQQTQPPLTLRARTGGKLNRSLNHSAEFRPILAKPYYNGRELRLLAQPIKQTVPRFDVQASDDIRRLSVRPEANDQPETSTIER